MLILVMRDANIFDYPRDRAKLAHICEKKEKRWRKEIDEGGDPGICFAE